MGARLDKTLDEEQTPSWFQDAEGLGKPEGAITPVVDGAERPEDRGTPVGKRNVFGRTLNEGDVARVTESIEASSDAQHDRRWIDPRDLGTLTGSDPSRCAWTTSDVDHLIIQG